MEIKDLVKEVHKTAVEHGWWKEDRSFGEIIALCHSELSEALEEYRKGYKPTEIYYGDCSNDKCKHSFMRCAALIKTNSCKYVKPEGIPIELADCIIRILDYCGKEGIDIKNHEAFWIEASYKNFGDFISFCHLCLSKAFELQINSPLIRLIDEIAIFSTKESIDLENALKIKMEYNKTRPYKHGNKVI